MNSWFPSPFGSSSSSSNTSPGLSSSTSSTMNAHNRTSDRTQSPSNGPPSPSEAAGVISRLKDKSTDELKKLLTDKSTYEAFFNSLEQVKVQNSLRRELWEETLQLARENLEKEPRISELRNQARFYVQ
ncbi:vacuolar protein-sorting-associated protein 37-like protein 1-like [Iris pallida]|uniref:Vacuolar protein-sorting-associated protein 37-like protein 1-like n=1 Tax=Iris pallida TaxID=29817 RepID=A0AAX6FN01_IRIPA|nr:vacuolar protein-sorting-associated protein 37-like protein 1-like [Iris pallida]KAJ6817683.1 vacuolar protein-sorting-associated protein 37-like protein 1-like [Iris pallida]